MEEIANEQREISDEKREEAIRHTRVANEMRLRSELERQNALEAERNAVLWLNTRGFWQNCPNARLTP